MSPNILRRVLCMTLLLISSCFSFSQANKPQLDCPCTVNAGPDKQLCEPGGAVQLNGTSTGNPLSYSWTPITGLSNPNIKSPVATVTETTTYTLSIQCLSTTNLVDNADFQQGNTGFTSDYTYSTNLIPEGLYCITNNPQSVHPGFAPCTDHTGGGGQMMVVNGAGTPNLNVWCQTITVQPNTIYAFETWVTSVVASSPAFLQFSINGSTIGPIFQAPGTTCQWVQFTATWDSGSNTSATICIVNQNTTLGGNDFALDDISFKEVCVLTDEMTITVNPIKHTDLVASICQGQTYKVGTQTFSNEGSYQVNLKSWKSCDSIVSLDLSVIDVVAEIDPPDNLDCGLTEVVLHGDQSSFGAEYTYLWTTTNGHITSDPTQWEIIVDKPGTYKLTVTYKDGTIICTKTASVTVGTDYKKPLLDAGKDGQITCTDTLLTLHGKAINPSNNFLVNWTTPNGKIVSKTDTINPTVGGPGMYIMKLTSNYNGCSALDTVIVTADSTLPKAIITGAPALNCYQNKLWLDASKSDQGAGFSFMWNIIGGQVDSKIDSLQILVSKPGDYDLIISDLVSGCKTSAKFTLSSDMSIPSSDAGPKDTLSCSNPLLKLTGSTGIPDSVAKYSWTSLNGKIISGKDSLSPSIGAPGLYYFKVLNIANGCSSIDSVLIEKDVNSPVVTAGNNDTLTCLKKSIALSAVGSSVGPDLVYSWTTSNGNITGPTDAINTTATQTGQYAFTVFNTLNGCQNTATVSVLIDTIAPKVNAGLDNTLTCITQTLSLNAYNGTSQGSKFVYSWSTVNGNILYGEKSLGPKVDKKGEYILMVTNKLNGCISKDSVYINEDQIYPDVSDPLNIYELTCKLPEVQLIPIDNSPPGQYDYQWTTSDGHIKSGANSLIATVDKDGLYSLIITNKVNGCKTAVSTNVLQAQMPTVHVGNDTSLNCKNKSITLNASYYLVYFLKTVTFNWTSTGGSIVSGADSLNAVINSPGLYTLTVIDTLRGCKASDSLKVSMDTLSPKANVLPYGKLNCLISSIDISAENNPGWTYLWTSQNGNILSGKDSSSVIVDKAGLYLLNITNNENGCTSQFGALAGEDKSMPVIDAGPPKFLNCSQSSATLDGNITGTLINKTINWTLLGQAITGGNSLSPIVDKTGLYTLMVTDELNGCTATDTTSVFENTDIPVGFQAEIIPPGCKVLGVVTINNIMGGVGPYQYSLNNGSYQNSNNFSNLISGNYNIGIEDINGCKYSEDLNVPEAQAFTVELPGDLTIEYGNDQQLHPILTIPQSQVDKAEWKPIEGLSCADCIEPIAKPLESIVYKLIITDKTGCTAKSQVRIFVFKDFGLYIPNAFSPNADGINDKWYVFGDPTKVVKINNLEIFDRWGERMFSAKDFPINDPDYGWNGKLRDKYLNSAVFVYYLEVEFIDGSTQLYKGDINLMR